MLSAILDQFEIPLCTAEYVCYKMHKYPDNCETNKFIFHSALQISDHVQTSLYLFNPWCRVLLEKLTGLQLVKKFPAFHGTRRFITALTSVRHLSLSWARPIQSIHPHPISRRSVLITNVPIMCLK